MKNELKKFGVGLIEAAIYYFSLLIGTLLFIYILSYVPTVINKTFIYGKATVNIVSDIDTFMTNKATQK